MHKLLRLERQKAPHFVQYHAARAPLLDNGVDVIEGVQSCRHPCNPSVAGVTGENVLERVSHERGREDQLCAQARSKGERGHMAVVLVDAACVAHRVWDAHTHTHTHTHTQSLFGCVRTRTTKTLAQHN